VRTFLDPTSNQSKTGPRTDSWNRSWLLIRQSFGLLRKDKKLLVFPAASGLSVICVALSFMLPLVEDGSISRYVENGSVEAQTALWLFLWYYFHYFVILFFNSALVACANMRLAGAKPSLKIGLVAAADRLFPISMWTLVASTVGVALRLIESRSNRLNALLSGFLGVGWTIATYFVGPVLMFEESSVLPALKRSVEITRRTWGEQFSKAVGFGIFTFLFAIPGLLMFAAGVFINPALMLPALLYGLMLSVVLSAARTVFTVALYRFVVSGETPAGFTRESMAGNA
jgi:Family of unknown function (DUF6159)